MTQPKAGTRKYSVPAMSVHTSSPRTCHTGEAVGRKREMEEKIKEEEEVETEKKTIRQHVNYKFHAYIWIHVTNVTGAQTHIPANTRKGK